MQMLTRRGFLARGAAGVAALSFPALATGAAKTIAVYRLDPCGGSGCTSCAACVQHDESSIFPTEKHANGNRAHIGCDCAIEAGRMHYGTYVALFGHPNHLRAYRADLRHARTRTLLKQHPPAFGK